MLKGVSACLCRERGLCCTFIFKNIIYICFTDWIIAFFKKVVYLCNSLILIR